MMKHLTQFSLFVFFLLYGTITHSQNSYTAPLSGEQEVHDVTSPATGSVSLELIAGDTLVVQGSFENLMSAVDTSIAGGAHIHAAPAGRNGPVLFPLDISLSSDGRSGEFRAENNRFALDPATIERLQLRQLYVNIHSVTEAAGELRGQVVPDGPQLQFISLSGDQEVPPVMTSGFGAVIAEIYSDSLIVTGSFSDLSGELDTTIAGGVHIHEGNSDENGPVEFLLQPTIDMELEGGVFSPINNTISIGVNEKMGLTLGSYYVNIHSTQYPNGELRGQFGQILNAENYTVSLTGRQQVHSVMTTASGVLDVRLVDDLAIVSGSFSGLSTPVDTNIVGGAHIHMGLAGSNGPVIFPLNAELDSTGTSGQFSMSNNVFTLTSDQINNLRSREWYVNIHSERWAQGEIRGQILPDADDYYFFKLFGSNEVPSAMTTAKGAVTLELQDGEIIASGSFQGLQGELATDIAGGMHLHEGRPGENGPVLFPLDVQSSMDLTSGRILPANNRIPFQINQMDLLEEKMIYANVHSTQFPGGEIRGQLTDINSQITYRAHLSGMNEIPAAMSPGNGQVLAEWKDGMIQVNGSFQNLSSNVATNVAGGIHLHDGFAGQNGPVLISLQPELSNDSLAGTFSPMENSYSLNTAESEMLMERQIYLNIHSMNIPSGELRGQLLPESQIVFNAQLLSSQAIPNAKSMGIGGLKLELNDDQLTVSGSYGDLTSAVDTSIVGGFHLHSGRAGQTGPVAIVLNSDFIDASLEGALLQASDNQFTLSEMQIEQIMSRGIYANLHTQSFAAGELRGQVLPEAGLYFYAPLSGVAQVPQPANTMGTGMAILEMTSNQALLSGSFSDLSTAVDTSIAGGIHIHSNWAGANGPVIRLVETDFGNDLTSGMFGVERNGFEWTTSELVALMERGLYVNVHSLALPAGEIRGQILPPAQLYMRASFNGQNEVQPIQSDASGSALVEINTNRITVSGGFENLESHLNTDIEGGVHIHEGSPAVNGGIELIIQTNLATDSMNGAFLASQNTFEAEMSDVQGLMDEDRYFNIHSRGLPGGELRGQILEEVNFFPSSSPEILTPANGSDITIEGDTAQMVNISWADEGMDENKVVYLWELASDESFDSTAVLMNVGQQTSLQISFGQIGNLLEALNIGLSDTTTLFHRVVTSDGSVMMPGAAASLTIQNGTTTSNENPGSTQGYDFTIFPTVSNGSVQIQMDQPRGSRPSANSEVVVRNALGQTIDILPMTNSGSTRQQNYQFGSNASGLYVFYWVIDGQIMSTQKVILQ
jgi:hypothetical protein